MNSSQASQIFLFLVLFNSIAQSIATVDYLISCGIPKSTTVSTYGNRIWQSDDNSTFAPPNINAVSSAVKSGGDQGVEVGQFTGARLFRAPVTYTFPISPGPKFLRFYFTTSTPYNNIPPSQFFLSLEANGVALFHNYSAFLNSQNDFTEFHLTVQNGTNTSLNLTFSSGNYPNCSSCFGFVNGIEIISVQDGLYFNTTRVVKNVNTGQPDYSYQQDSTAFQTMYRVNVGGSDVDPVNDTGEMFRTWVYDQKYLDGGFVGTTPYPPYGTEGTGLVHYTTQVPSYVAPKHVYATLRNIWLGYPKGLAHNLTWRFDVDPGFDYLVRLHFCEMNRDVHGTGQRVFQVYINKEAVGGQDGIDVWFLADGRGSPVFIDYLVSFSGNSNGTKVPLWLALHPFKTKLTDVLLNGLEILKLNQSNGNLAVPNPPPTLKPNQEQPIRKGSNDHNSLLITGGVIGGVLLISLIIYGAFVLYKRRPKNKSFKTSTSLSKRHWFPISPESNSMATTTASLRLSLPSDLCRRFPLGQIRVATCNFDEKLIIGRGGFGKVYKGSIDDGATIVAIKRLNPTSKQGFNEFQTEIEMLSRLRHVHLVSLIGYCDDNDEMILVYEYMPRGTLRDHLGYKDNNDSNSNSNSNNEPLSWKQRLMICVGSARGLHYLHAGTKQLIIHRDVKSTNILLDDKWAAKVSDFGLSKVGPASESGIGHVSTAVKGSVGYLDPEYYRRQQLTEKSDVYSFGVVLYEVLCARPAMNPNLPREQVNLAVWARSCYKNGTLHTIVDPYLTGRIAHECLRKFGEIAEMCVRDHGTERPSMGDVVWSLEFALQLQQTAEKNIIGDNGIVGQTFEANNIANGGIIDDDDVFTNTSGENFSQSSVGGRATSKLEGTSRDTTNTSISDYPIEMRSGSVFSEIKDPQAR